RFDHDDLGASARPGYLLDATSGIVDQPMQLTDGEIVKSDAAALGIFRMDREATTVRAPISIELRLRAEVEQFAIIAAISTDQPELTTIGTFINSPVENILSVRARHRRVIMPALRLCQQVTAVRPEVVSIDPGRFDDPTARDIDIRGVDQCLPVRAHT